MPERIIRPGILTSERVNSLSWAAEVFYRRLFSVADDYGRYDGRNAILRANLYPLQIDRVTERDVGKWKAESSEAGLVTCYSVDGREYIQIEKFDQRLRAKTSKWPPPATADTRGHPHASAVKCIGIGIGIGDGSTPTNARARASDEAEVLSKPDAIARCMALGVLEDFVSYVHDDWSSRGGRDASGQLVPFVKYVSKRWTREGEDWKRGVHRGQQRSAKNGKPPDHSKGF